MSQLYGLAIFTVSLGALIWFTLSSDNRLKGVSAFLLVMAVVSAPTLNQEWTRMTSELIDDEGNSHNGLPDIWLGKQVVCVDFPVGAAHSDYADGRHYIDYDGTDFMTETEFNGTGACVGGLSGYENGFGMLLNATDIAEGDLEVVYSTSQYGVMIETIGGVDPCDYHTCSSTQGAYWSLYHNNAWSMVGIGDLVLVEDSVLEWKIETW